MNQQRELIYSQRRQVLEGPNMKQTIITMGEKVLDDAVERFCVGEPGDWDIKGLTDEVERLAIPAGTMKANAEAVKSFDKAAWLPSSKDGRRLLRAARGRDHQTEHRYARTERNILLRSVDNRWMDHIDAMDQLRDLALACAMPSATR